MAIVDYLVMIALDEEDRYFSAVLKEAAASSRPARLIDGRLYGRSYLHVGDGSVSIVSAPIGRMGVEATQSAVEAAIRTWQPRDLLLIGIAGSFEPKSLLLGDVIVPAKIFGCTEAKLEEAGENVRRRYRKTGDRAASQLIDIVRGVVKDPRLSLAWHNGCLEGIQGDAKLRERLAKIDPERVRPRVHCTFNDSIVSSNDVIATKKALQDLRDQVDPTIVAAEMESKGLFEALERLEAKPSALIVRGISDYADKQKAGLDRKFKDGWRRFAMQNASRLALATITGRAEIDDESYRPLPGPHFDMRHAVNSSQRCSEAGVMATAAGAAAMAFPSAISWSSGTPKVDVEVSATAKGGAPLTFSQGLIRQGEDHTPLAKGTQLPALKCTIARTGTPLPLSLFLALPSAPERITFRLADEFGREAAGTWTA